MSPAEIQGPIPCDKLDPRACAGVVATTTLGPTTTATPSTTAAPTTTAAATTTLAGGSVRTERVSVARGADASMVLDASGLHGLYPGCRPLVRGMPLVAGEHVCPIPHIAETWRATTAGVTAAMRPAGLPQPWRPERSLEAGTVIASLPIWEQAWYYRAASACRTGSVPPAAWCGTAGCMTTTGTCALVAQSRSGYAVQDGTVTLVRLGFNAVAYGGLSIAEPAPNIQNPVIRADTGDNMSHALLIGRGYRNPGEQQLAVAGFYGDLRQELAAVTAGPTPPGAAIGVLAANTLGWPEVGPLITPIPTGTVPAGWSWCGTTAWIDPTSGGRSVTGPLRCVTLPAPGGVRVCQPERDGWRWPIIWRGGQRAVAAVYGMWLPHAIAEYPDPEPFVVGIDWLYEPADCFNLTNPDTQEYESPGQLNTSGGLMARMGDATVNTAETWRSGLTVGIPGHIVPPVENGWLYEVWGSQCDAACRRCANRRRATTAIAAASSPVWRTDTVLPFCDANGVAYRRLAPRSAALILQGGRDTLGEVSVYDRSGERTFRIFDGGRAIRYGCSASLPSCTMDRRLEERWLCHAPAADQRMTCRWTGAAFAWVAD